MTPSINLLARYDDYIIHNASTVTSIESTLRTLTYLLPGRFQDSNIASEGLSSFINLLGTYHDTILARAVEKLDKKPTLSGHNKYTKFWSQRSTIYRHLSIGVTCITHLQLLFELLARKKFGEKGRWKGVISIELVKAFCRLCILNETRRAIVTPLTPTREVDPEVLEQQLDIHVPQRVEWTKEGINAYLVKKVIHPEQLRQASDLMSRLTYAIGVSEVIYIVRPVIYAILLARYPKVNWRPWFIGLALEYASRELYRLSTRRKRVISSLEKEEMTRRTWAMAWWVLRGAAYQNYTKPKIQALTERLERVPVVSILGGLVKDYEYWLESYFTTASI